ncbi:flavin-dependent oxidoreductase, F420-dependent methylene-tetrahydromethanopterin reductase [Frankia sp. EI5c]|uniref:LLM class flavin-dependent oxidoreductase n=1 Tax=Frankia sp. EI5c TaxID=683316 RepID=UPI0007C269C9|nr:LLM class flavin-dependent oxidoreductase [Frankia sp. EI5c]OAA19779.1 flavin-dependent oxidoreductase, F420-dependent methylene-tetrahydromethanopterin reductase [Frankia sp. EI5c]
MRVGLGYLNMAPAGDAVTARDLYAGFLRDARWAQAAGFAGIWITEHHFSTYSLTSSPLLLLAQAALAAPGLRLGTSVLVLPFWDPVRLAADALTLDALSGGRLDLGIGRGYQPHEFLGFGRDPAENRAVFAEAVDLLQQLLTRPDEQFSGRFHQVNAPVTVLPRPAQQPHPPIWMAATSEESLRFAADRDFNFMLPAGTTFPQIVERRQWIEQAGGLPAGREFQVNRFVYLGDDEGREQAVREIARQLQTSAALAEGTHPGAGAAPTPATPDPAMEEKAREVLIAGSAPEVLERFRELAAAGITYVIASFAFGYLHPRVSQRSRRRFAAQVLPYLSGS